MDESDHEWMHDEECTAEIVQENFKPASLPFGQMFEVGDFNNLSDEDVDPTALEDAGFKNGFSPVDSEVRLLKGQTFSSWLEFEEAMDDYQGLTGFTFKRISKDTDAIRAVCRGWKKGVEQSCKVELSVRCLKKSGIITVTKAFLSHTCPTGIHKFRNGANRTRWVARKIRKHVQINPSIPMKQLNENLRSFHETQSVPWTLQRARSMCREDLTGGSKDGFQMIPSYVEAIRKADSNADAHYQTGPEQRFARLYIASSSSMNVFNHSRPLVGLDGTHTSGKFPMILLFATCFDGENHIVILAWAVVEVENKDNWTWFLEHLRKSYAKMRDTDTVFISDRDKGLQAGVADVFPDANHAHCVQHLRTNIKGNVDAHSSKYFKKIVEAKTKEEFEQLINSFEPLNERQKKFVPYIRKMNEYSYARHAFPGRRYGHYTSNVVEIINAAVKPCRAMAAFRLCDYLWTYSMERHYERSQHAQQLPPGDVALTEYGNNLLARLYAKSRVVKEKKSSEHESLMFDGDGSWVVRITERFCECGNWKEMDFPCCHAIKFFSDRNMEPRCYVGDVWLAKNQVDAYGVPVPAMSIDRLQMGTKKCLEPVIKVKKRIRHSVKRHPGWSEQMARQNGRLVFKQSQKCSTCKLPGHNKRNCTVVSLEPNVMVSSTPVSGVSSFQSTPDIASTSSHDVHIVGADHTAIRQDMEDDWHLFHTRSSTVSYAEWFESQPSQVTQ